MTTKAQVLRAIRHKCLDCSCYQINEVRECALQGCALWPFRMGMDPNPAKGRGFAAAPHRAMILDGTGRFADEVHPSMVKPQGK